MSLWQNRSTKKFLGDLFSQCFLNRINLKVLNQKTISGASGFFDEKTLGLAQKCFGGEPEIVLGTLVHESCHLDQFLENAAVWRAEEVDAEYDLWDEYNKGGVQKGPTLKKYMQGLLRLEIDCEKRSVEKIKKYSLPIDIERYKKNGSIYLYSYRVFFEERARVGWYTKLLKNDNLVDKMPKDYLDWEKYWSKANNPIWKVYSSEN